MDYSGENRTASRDMQSCQATDEPICTGPRQAHRENDSHHPSNLPGPTEVSKLAETENPDSSRSQSYETTVKLDQDALMELEW